MHKILMIASNNLCRSPIAQAAMNLAIKDAGVENEWVVHCASLNDRLSHLSPDPRVFSVLKEHGIDFDWYPRKITMEDFQTYDYMFSMDENNWRDMTEMASGIKNCKVCILLLGDFGLDPLDRSLLDPFHVVGEVYFDKIFRQSYPASKAFLNYALIEHAYNA